MFDRGLRRYVFNSRQKFRFHNATSHSSELQGNFAQLWSKMETYVRNSWILISLHVKFSPFYTSYKIFNERKEPKCLLSITTKSTLTTTLVLKFERLTDFNRRVACQVYLPFINKYYFHDISPLRPKIPFGNIYLIGQ
jgi:hypothetical protein